RKNFLRAVSMNFHLHDRGDSFNYRDSRELEPFLQGGGFSPFFLGWSSAAGLAGRLPHLSLRGRGGRSHILIKQACLGGGAVSLCERQHLHHADMRPKRKGENIAPAHKAT